MCSSDLNTNSGDYRKLLYKYNIHHVLPAFWLTGYHFRRNVRIIHRFIVKHDIFKTEQLMSAIAPGMILFAYLCGSISSAILVCRLCGLPDPRTSGSGNPGATNVLRMGGKGAALAVLIFDVLKGMLPVWGAYELGVSPFWLGLIAIAACLGHIWPIFFGFKGGKGVATAFGAIAPIGWDLTGVMAGTWLLTVLLSGYSSLGAIVSALIAPFYVWWFKPQFTFPVSMLSCLILLRHHDNIQRLWRRQETKIWTKLKRKREKDPE